MTVWRFVTAWPRGFVSWVHQAFCALTTEDGRKGWAMLAALGCCVVMTCEVGFVLWLVKKSPMLAFWIGMSAQAVNFIVVTGLMVLIGVRRKTGGSITLPGGGSASLSVDDGGAPVLVTSTPVAAPAASGGLLEGNGNAS
jgi:hypothetical protein